MKSKFLREIWTCVFERQKRYLLRIEYFYYFLITLIIKSSNPSTYKLFVLVFKSSCKTVTFHAWSNGTSKYFICFRVSICKTVAQFFLVRRFISLKKISFLSVYKNNANIYMNLGLLYIYTIRCIDICLGLAYIDNGVYGYLLRTSVWEDASSCPLFDLRMFYLIYTIYMCIYIFVCE